MKHYTIECNGLNLPYSSAVEARGVVYVSGQLPLNPLTGELVSGGIIVQTEQVFENLRNVLSLAELSLDSVIKITVFLSDMADFQEMNSVYAQQFSTNFPARSAIAVKGIPRGALVEIEAVAVR